jgi:WD40-like Beta Propeller Repeat
MPKRLLAVPPVIVLAIALYVAAVPSHRSAGQAPPATPITEATSPAATAVSPDALSGGPPSGLTGRLTYRTEREFVTVEFPSGDAIDHGPLLPIDGATFSADELLSITTICSDACELVIGRADGTSRTVDVPLVASFSWSPEGHRLALTAPKIAEHPTSYKLMILDDPTADEPRTIYETRVGNGHPFEWLASDDLIIADNDGTNALLQRVAPDGAVAMLATVPAPVNYLYAAPDRRTIAFTQDSPDGWQLWTVDSATGEVRNAGNMGSDPAGVAPPDQTPPIHTKGPMYVAWSPDGQRVAFGGGYEPPYIMTIANIASGEKHRTEFPDGYPGEIKWSPDGTTLAVSTYNIERTHHESYVVDPDTGVAQHVVSGCVIVWSADSRFLAIHGEREPGITIADVVTLAHVQLTHTVNDTPLRWEP